jgi:cytochrome c biogenesis protein CcmG/thiol:disulfide interchange protein DsbE
MSTRYLLPLAVFLALVGLFYFALHQIGQGEYNPRDIPSPLVGKAAPAFTLESVHNPGKPLSDAAFREHPVSLFNVWASWCVACRQEHPFLMELSRQKAIPIYGLNYKDERGDALAWLDRFGNPYLDSAWDHKGNVGIDWGVYGVPETFVVDRQGMIRSKFIGPLTPQAWREKLLPIIEQVRAEAK